MREDGEALVVTTRPIEDARGADAAARSDLGPAETVWARGPMRLVGYGAAARLAFQGPERIHEASDAWRALAAAAVVDDEVGVPGSGLTAFGAFSFDDASAAQSVLVVPRVVVGVRDGRAFRTEVAGTGRRDAPAPLPAGPRAHQDGAGYRAAVDAAVGRIRSGALDKVVLARDVALTPPPELSIPAAVRSLAERYRQAWTFLVDGFVGASPETLVTSDRTRMTARVLAGTAPRHPDAAADAAARDALLASPKNRFEHALAVDSLLLALGDDVAGLELGRPFALGLPNVWHLATDAHGRVTHGAGVLELVRALHPTAAVAGAPTAVALELIRELEPFDRRRYAGPVGWVGAAGDGEWAIGLRSAESEADGRLRAYAGAGIVAGSDAAGELAETEWKLRPMRDAFGRVSAAAPRAATVPSPAR